MMPTPRRGFCLCYTALVEPSVANRTYAFFAAANIPAKTKSSLTLFEPCIYPNMLNSIKLTSSEIEQQVKKIHNYLTDLHEHEKFFPAEKKFPFELARVFYRMIISTLKSEQNIPTQNEFLSECKVEMAINGFDYEGQCQKMKAGINHRILVTYPSLVRDIHLAKLFEDYIKDKELGNKYSILYNCELDLRGIDVLLHSKTTGRYFGVCLYIDAKYAKTQLDRKQYTRIPFYNLEYIEYPKKPNNKNNDEIWLYDRNDIDAILRIIESYTLPRYITDISCNETCEDKLNNECLHRPNGTFPDRRIECTKIRNEIKQYGKACATCVYLKEEFGEGRQHYYSCPNRKITDLRWCCSKWDVRSDMKPLHNAERLEIIL